MYTQPREKYLKSFTELINVQLRNTKSQRKLSTFAVTTLPPTFIGKFKEEKLMALSD
jgi:hypothetical protein